MDMNKTKCAVLLAAAAALACAGEADNDTPRLRVGGDFRARQEKWDFIPIPTESPDVTRGGYNDSFRFRSRLWASYDLFDEATVNVRLAHMFYEVTAGPDAFEWPDELVLDNANIELRGLTGDGSKLVAGRQDIILGSGRLVLEGTALDASRTTYFDGIFLHQPMADGLSADIFAVYDKDEDPLAVGNVHRQVRGYSPAVDGRDEAGAGVFLNSGLCGGALPVSLYYIWKHETSARAADGAEIENADIHTIGLLTRPKLSRMLSGEIEFARQIDPASDDGIDAMLAYAGLFLDIDMQKMPASDSLYPKAVHTTRLGLDVTYLSGDDPDSRRNEAFNPIFSRYPMLSELVVYSYDTEGAANWNNLIYPRISATFGRNGHSLNLAGGPMFAEERNGAGGGRHRGELYTAQYNIPLLKGARNKFGKTDGHVRVEVFEPGDYYTSDRTSYYFRWEILVSF